MQQLPLPAREIPLPYGAAATRPVPQQGQGRRVRLVAGDRATGRATPAAPGQGAGQ